MTKILSITGPDDYHALNFEQNFKLQDVVEKIEKENIDDYLVFEGDEYYFEATLLEFNNIDPLFIKFIKDMIQDYDSSLNTNFYLVE